MSEFVWDVSDHFQDNQKRGLSVYREMLLIAKYNHAEISYLGLKKDGLVLKLSCLNKITSMYRNA